MSVPSYLLMTASQPIQWLYSGTVVNSQEPKTLDICAKAYDIAGISVLEELAYTTWGYLSINFVRTNGPTLCPIVWLPYAPEYVDKTS